MKISGGRQAFALHVLRMGLGALLAGSGLALSICGSVAQAQLPGTAAPNGNGVGSAFELTFWQSIATSDDRAQYEAYLAQYPNGTFSALARAKIAMIDRTRGAGAGGTQPAAPVAGPAPAPMPALPPAPTSTPAPAATSATVAPVAPVAPVAQSMSMPVPLAIGEAGAAPAPDAAPVPSTSVNAVGGAVPADAPSDPFAKMAAGRAAAAAVATGGRVIALPSRPILSPLPDVTLPATFCSALDRNRFHDTIYRPAVDVAEQNNRATIAHMIQLQSDYDARSARFETEAANELAREAEAYKATAQKAYAMSLPNCSTSALRSA